MQKAISVNSLPFDSQMTQLNYNPSKNLSVGATKDSKDSATKNETTDETLQMTNKNETTGDDDEDDEEGDNSSASGSASGADGNGIDE